MKNTQDKKEEKAPPVESTPKEGADIVYNMTGAEIYERGFAAGYDEAIVAFVKGMLIAVILYSGMRLLISTSE